MIIFWFYIETENYFLEKKYLLTDKNDILLTHISVVDCIYYKLMMYRYNTYKVFIAILWQFLYSWLNILGLLIRAKSFPFAVLWCLGVQWLSSLWFYYVMNFCSSSTLWHVISRGFCFLLWRFLCMVCIHVHILDFVLFFFNDLTWILVRFLDRFVDI